MANTAYTGNTSRPHWGGANSDVDQHLEVYQSEVDTRFQYMALFRGLSAANRGAEVLANICDRESKATS